MIAALALAAAPVVDARAYDSFWLWAGIGPRPELAAVLARAKRVYLLDGEIKANGRFLAQRPAVPNVRGADVWLVVRVETLVWPSAVHRQLLTQLTRWRAAGNRVAGVQIDFDAGTKHLANYAAFLRALRAELPRDCRLGITGLLDWSANGDPAGLTQLAGTVDEVVIQIYQGRHVIPGYAGYLARLDRLPIPFRVGLLEGGEWRAPPNLTANPRFRGYVVFLTRGLRQPARA